jgi:hypothetical protein
VSLRRQCVLLRQFETSTGKCLGWARLAPPPPLKMAQEGPSPLKQKVRDYARAATTVRHTRDRRRPFPAYIPPAARACTPLKQKGAAGCVGGRLWDGSVRSSQSSCAMSTT